VRGSAVSHYRLLDKLGEGGMGVVYRAEDLKLGRHVAVKFLPLVDGDLPEAVLRRFEREARAASALNHANICTIHGLEDFDGRSAIVMELVEGETLAARLARGRLPIEESVRIAVQIADALTEAHRRGVVAKVLDFGLATMERPVTSTPDAEAMTDRGAIVGSLHYMSPEQVEGKDADTRSDIFSFGLVLYEMVTGQRAFEAESRAGLIAAILGKEPPPFEPESRIAMERVSSRRRHAIRTLVSKMAVNAGGRILRSYCSSRLDVASARERGPILSHHCAVGGCPAFGIELVSGNLTRRFLCAVRGERPIVGASSRRFGGEVAGAVDERPGSLVPRLRFAAFRQGPGIVEVRLPDGPPELLARFNWPTRGGSWSDDGTILVSAGPKLYEVPASGGEIIPVDARVLRPAQYRWPQFLPGGDDFLFLLVPPDGREAEVYLATLRHGQVANPVRLMENDTAAAYTPAVGGCLLFVRNDNLYAQKLDGRKRRLIGQAQFCNKA
jgi:eukaryotic-like serine/threonine-protein kinase